MPFILAGAIGFLIGGFTLAAISLIVAVIIELICRWVRK